MITDISTDLNCLYLHSNSVYTWSERFDRQHIFVSRLPLIQSIQLRGLSQIDRFSLSPNEGGSKRGMTVLEGAGILARGTRSCT